jgi:hypothetical protein
VRPFTVLALFPEYGGPRFFENNDTSLPTYMTSHPTKTKILTINTLSHHGSILDIDFADTFSKVFLI